MFRKCDENRKIQNYAFRENPNLAKCSRNGYYHNFTKSPPTSSRVLPVNGGLKRHSHHKNSPCQKADKGFLCTVKNYFENLVALID